MMKTKTAIHIAEHLFEDTIRDGSIFDAILKMAPVISKLRADNNYKEIDENILEVKAEMIARWANIIMDSEKHVIK
jgi:hypothetical protein